MGDHRDVFQRATRRLPGPKVAGATVHLAKASPLVFLDASWSAAERAKIFSNLQSLTDDKLTLSGLEVYSDGSAGVGSPHAMGTALLRGVQDAKRKVTIAPSVSLIPMTSAVGSDIRVQLDFSPFRLFVREPIWQFGNTSWVEVASSTVIMGHELIHAYRLLRNAVAGGVTDNVFFDAFGNQFTEHLFIEEMIVMGLSGQEPITENVLRGEQGLNRRVAYASPTLSLDKQGVTPMAMPPEGSLFAPGSYKQWWPDYPP